MSAPTPAAPRPTTITVAAALVGLEGLSALVFGVVEAGQIRMSRAVVGVGVSLLMIAYAALLLAAARGLLRGRRWSRGPALATQLILVPVGWNFRGGETTWVSVVMVGVAVVTAISLLHPRSTAYLVPSVPST